MKQKKYQKIIPEKHVRRIRAMMILKGVTYTDIARTAGTAVNTVRVVLNGFSASRRIQQAAADLLGMSCNPLHSGATFIQHLNNSQQPGEKQCRTAEKE